MGRGHRSRALGWGGVVSPEVWAMVVAALLAAVIVTFLRSGDT